LRLGAREFKVLGDLTIRGVTRPAVLDVQFLGTWSTPWWEGNVDKGPKIRAGFAGTPPHRAPGGTSSLTMLVAAICAPSPMRT